MTVHGNSSLDQVDMMQHAREAQWSALSFLGPHYKKAVAPAKVNLFLAVGEKMESGYHELTNIMHALALHDTLFMAVEPSDASDDDESSAEQTAFAGPAHNLSVSIDLSDKTNAFATPMRIPPTKNLVFKAVDALAHEMNQHTPQRISIRLEKHIPSQAGLAGGSSNAAAALLLLAAFWDIDSHDERVVSCAQKLGADVVFFLHGGCGLYTHTGDVYEHRLQPMNRSIVIVKPDIGVSTVRAYAHFDEAPQYAPEDLLKAAFDATRACDVPLYNNLDTAALSLAPALADVRQWLCEQEGITPESVLMCGSGAAFFALTESFSHASRIATKAKAAGFWAKPTTCSALRAAVM